MRALETQARSASSLGVSRTAGEHESAHDGHLAAHRLVDKTRNVLVHAAKLGKELTPKLMEIGIFHRKPLTLETIFGER